MKSTPMTFYRFLLVAALAVGLTDGALAQTFSEGKITYAISMTMDEQDGQALDPKVRSMMPQSATQFVKGKKSRMEMASGMGTTINITDYSTEKMVTLMDIQGRKLKQERSLQDRTSRGDLREFKYTGEKKTIAGYSCERVLMNIYDAKQDRTLEMEWWVTNQISLPAPVDFSTHDFKGFPLEFDLASGGPSGLTMHMVATKVEKSVVSDSKFDIPGGYEAMPVQGQQPASSPPAELKTMEQPIK